MDVSNESFPTDASGPDFSNGSFTTNASGPDFSNESFTTNASGPVLSSPTLPAEPAVIIIEAVLAIVGNLLVIAATTRRQTFPSASRLFISSMACSDLLQGLTFAFLVAPAGAGERVYSGTAARACTVMLESSAGLSASALAALCAQHEPPAAPVININVNGPGVPNQNANPQQQAPQNDNSDRSYAKAYKINGTWKGQQLLFNFN
ncbi:Hypp1572 [Branchiostoma lanceolatum]|uniref:Hypp1572 protein n=1 Tax=Branchiostoma lanceolatum TaxID=7740 RepID=A0A8K0ELF1_BRALA|nr:Hypp1572 [Branchiostoma lanceolatum]